LKHYLFKIAASVSLVLTLAMIALRVRSQFVCDRIWRLSKVTNTDGNLDWARGEGEGWDLGSARGRLWIAGRNVEVLGPVDELLDSRWHWKAEHRQSLEGVEDFFFVDQNAPEASSIGFGMEIGSKRGRSSVVIPHWFAIAIFAVLPICYVVRRLRTAKRLRIGCCANCGYDLRATPERCPECGSLVTQTPS
jgi:hypothetical protein